MIDDMYLIILSVVVLLFICLVILTYKTFDFRNRNTGAEEKQIIHKETTPPAKENLLPKRKIPAPKRTIVADVNLTEGVSDINESMKRYAQKYILGSATLASADGFSLASSLPNSEKEAANLTARYRENGITEIGDTHMIPLDYRGEEILILFRTKNKINPEQADMMRRDGCIILSKWL